MKSTVIIVLFALFLLKSNVSMRFDVLEGRNWQQCTYTATNPINNHVFDVGVTTATPFQWSGKHGIEVAARVVEGEYDECCADKGVDDCSEARVEFGDALRSNATEESGNSFDESTEVGVDLKKIGQFFSSKLDLLAHL